MKTMKTSHNYATNTGAATTPGNYHSYPGWLTSKRYDDNQGPDLHLHPARTSGHPRLGPGRLRHQQPRQRRQLPERQLLGHHPEPAGPGAEGVSRGANIFSSSRDTFSENKLINQLAGRDARCTESLV